MKMATCYIPPTSGKLKVCGFDVLQDPLKVRKIIGYLPEHNPLYLDMYVHEYLAFIGGLHGIKGKRLKDRITEMIKMTGLSLEQRKKIGALSKGYRQRVGLAQALIHDPMVLILDEPTTGLDPNQLADIRRLIKQISKEKTVIFSTHIMQEVQALCDRVIIINHGKIVKDSQVDELKGEGDDANYLVAEFSEDIDELSLKEIDGVLDVVKKEGHHYIIKVVTDKEMRGEIFNYSAINKITLLELRKEEASLESVFQELTKGK
jgi:ABC-2 type transport system ATP-binding protein